MSTPERSSKPDADPDTLFSSFLSGAKFGLAASLLTVLVVKLGASV